MTSTHRVFHAALTTLIVFYIILQGTSPACAEPTYNVTDLGRVECSRDDVFGAMAINERGQVVGGNGHAFLWADGKMTNFRTLTPSYIEDTMLGVAHGINNRVQIVGSSGSFGPIFMSGLQFARGIIIKNRVMHQFTGNNVSFYPYAINDAGEIVGLDGYRGFYYAHGRLTEMGTLSKVPQGNRSTARSISQKGQVVGWTTVNGPRDAAYGLLPTHAFLWQYGIHGDRMRDLGTLPGWRSSYAYGINNRGEVTGSVSDETSQTNGLSSESHAAAFLWHSGKMTALETLPGSKYSEAFGINDHTAMVGTCGARAVLWQSGKVLDLNTQLPDGSGWMLEEARAVNNRGQIVGNGTFHGQRHIFLLTPRQSN